MATVTAPQPTPADPSFSPSNSTDCLTTGEEVRRACRNQLLTTYTSGLAPTYLQVNLLVLPSQHAADFRLLCRRNPVPCPLLAESLEVGDFDQLQSRLPGISNAQLATNVDLRHDFPRYNIYADGELAVAHVTDVASHWRADHVAFLVGCSFSFETALAHAGLPPPHTLHARNVPMYRTTVPLCPAGVFRASTYVVSMRAYRRVDVERVRAVTRPYTATHGEPIAWGWDGAVSIGVRDIGAPQWGDPPVTADGLPLTEGMGAGDDEVVPVFWGCGVTPQEAVMKARLPGTVLSHAPGHMLVLDLKDEDVRSG